MDISEIKDLINAISNSKIDIFDYEENGAKLHLEKKTEVEVIASPKPVAQDVLVKQENTEESIEQKEVLTGNVINSPLLELYILHQGRRGKAVCSGRRHSEKRSGSCNSRGNEADE